MTQDDLDLTPVTESLDYPPILNAVVPAVMLGVTAVYAWSLRGIDNPEMNLLLLKPLFAVIAALLFIVMVKDVLPSIRAQSATIAGRGGASLSWSDRFAPGTEAGASLVVLATLIFSFFGPGDGVTVYLVSLFVYLAVSGWLMGDRQPLVLIARSALCAVGLYVVMGIVLGVPL